MMNKNVKYFPFSDKGDFDTLPYRFNYGEVMEKKKKRLLFVFPWLVIGGADKFNLDFLSGLDKNIYDVTIILTRQSCHEWKYRFEEISIVKEIFDIPSFLPRISWAGFFDYIMHTRNVDLVFFSNSLYGYHIIPWLKSYYPTVPFVDFLHAEDWFWKKGGLPRDSIAVSKFIDTTYSCTKHLVEVMKNEMKKQNDNDKVAYIGVDPNYYNRSKINIDNYSNVKKYIGKKVITFVCRLVHLKRPFFMLEVLKKLISIDNDYILFVVGDGPLYKEMIHRAIRMKLKDNVVFWGACDEVRPFYFVSSVTVVCSLTEGLALVAYESLSMEVPVVSSNVGGQAELINEDVGFVVNRYQDYRKDLYNYDYSEEEIFQYVNAIEKIVKNKNVDKIRKSCRQRIVNKFSIQKTIDKISQDFLKLIEIGSSVDTHLCDNIELNERYLVIYNESSKYYKPAKFLGSSSLIAILWSMPIYRKTIHLMQKIGIMKMIKKLLRRK
jgi:glycosyltransferase involved in cell wall biosynthesis